MSNLLELFRSFINFIKSIFIPADKKQQKPYKSSKNTQKNETKTKSKPQNHNKKLQDRVIKEDKKNISTNDEIYYKDETSIFIQESLTVDELVDYLVEVESYTIHYNSGERGKTAPAGIYYKYFPNWEGWRFLTQIAQENGIEFDPSSSDNVGCKELTKLVVTNYRYEFDELIYTFIKHEYYDKLNLDYFPGRKSALSYFSITVNGGRYRSAKILQKVLVENGFELKIDGKAGDKTYQALLECGLDDDYLNQQMLVKVYNFYNYLLSRNPKKYSIFYDGWINRLKRLGFIVPT